MKRHFLKVKGKKALTLYKPIPSKIYIAPGVLLHQGLLILRGTCDGIAGNGGAKRERGLFTFLPLNKSLLLEGFDNPNAHRLAILLCVSDVGENLG